MANAETRLRSTIARLNPGIDTSGPVSDLFIKPISSEVDSLDARIESVKNMFSGEFDPNRSEEEVLKIVATRSITRDEGNYATGKVVVRTATVPNNIAIPKGSVVTTVDGLYQYVTTEEFAPTTSELEAGFNSTISQYEYEIPIRALQIGSKYNIAATRLRTINVSLPAGCYITNTSSIVGGTDEQDLEDLWNDYKEASVLSDQSNRSGTARKLIKQFPSIKSLYIKQDMSPPSPRGAPKPIIQVYAIGEEPVSNTQSFVVGHGGKIDLPYGFIMSIGAIRRGSEQIVLFSVEGSTILLAEAYTVGETLTVSYTYNKLLNDLQEHVTNLSSDLFGHSMQVMAGTPEDLKARIQVRIQQGIIGSSAKAQIETLILTHFNSLYFSESDINLTDITALLKSNLAGIISATVLDLVLIRQTRQLTGFPLFITPPKYARLLVENLTVEIKTS